MLILALTSPQSCEYGRLHFTASFWAIRRRSLLASYPSNPSAETTKGAIHSQLEHSHRRVYSCWRPYLSFSGGEPAWTIWALLLPGSFAVILEEFIRIHVARFAALLRSYVDNR